MQWADPRRIDMHSLLFFDCTALLIAQFQFQSPIAIAHCILHIANIACGTGDRRHLGGQKKTKKKRRA
jgi:hypothetical protein